MNINDLNIFEAVALHGSFTKAAEALFTVQSNVTARIKNLEQEFGAQLFSRTSRKVELTSAGKTLLVYSKQITNLIQDAKLSVGKSETIKGEIKIGFLETTMTLKGPELVMEIAEKFPYINLDFKSAMRDQLIKDVLNYKLDAAFIPSPLDINDLEEIPIRKEKIVAVAPEKFAGLEELLSQQTIRTIVFDQGCFFRARLESWLVSKNIDSYHKTVMNSIEGVVNFIETGIGFSFLPYEIISKFYSNRKLKIFTLPEEIASMNTILIYKKENLYSPALKAFIGLHL